MHAPTHHPAAAIQSEVAPGLKVLQLRHHDLVEWFITATPRPGGDLRAMFADVHRRVNEAGATIVCMDVFGIPNGKRADVRLLHQEWGGAWDWPVTWLVEGASGGIALTGVQVHALTGTLVRRIRLDGRTVGSVYDDGHARHCHLGDLWPADRKLSRSQQARATFDLMETALAQADMKFSHVVRTWFYLDRLLEWYGEFNQVRNQFFRERTVFDGLVPASTGISGGNAAGAAIIADAYAIAPHDPRVRAQAVPSPLQCPALEYGSSFSRAVEVDLVDHRALYISGTASIEPGGRTAHVGDIRAQIELTMQVAGAILESRQMNWRDTTRAVAYIKHAAAAPAWRDWLAAHDLCDLPVVTTENDICRDDLLFEIELDAIRSVA